MAEKQRNLFCVWLVRWAAYLKGEATFDQHKMKLFRRGEIVLFDFGYRLKSELGGFHYAIILDTQPNPNNPLLTILPLSSLKEGRVVHRNDIDLGKALLCDVDPSTGKNIAKAGTSVAITQQLTCVSKQRVVRPLHSSDAVIGIVSRDKMLEIDRKITERYLTSN
jgi:mRNA-degrading endonuclease toxin of MazEF toxin-antitoxin module